MRLLDYDKLEDVALDYQDKHLGNELTVGDYKLIDNFMFEYPKVDAIPVGWLEQKYKENEPSKDKDDYDYFLWDAIAYILTIWGKDQSDTKTN